MNDLMNAPRRRRIGSETQVWEPTGISYPVPSQTAQKSESSTISCLNSSSFEQNSEMTCRDRTNEFIGAVKSLQGRQGNGVVPHQQLRKVKGLQQWSEFMRIAKLIGKDLTSTYTKLEKLAILARKKSLFDDKPLEIQELTYIIKQDINSLNKQISQLQELVRSRHQQNGKHMQSHSNSVVVSLQSKLALMSNEFKQVLEVRTENLRHQRSRREHFSHGPVASTLPASAASGYHQGSVLLADERSRDVTDVAINMDQIARPNQFQSMLMMEEQDSYLQSRADTMQNIETTIVELGGIFQQLAHMVKEQEEMIQRIDSNVEDVQMNVEGAHGEILKYFQSVTSNRWLMFKIFGVLILFFILFVILFA
uniref:t-SNARE coiled-coil homology domain-containing protein n=1 Tax=Strigamia maritima TaxID=126957 RepID=T1JGD8_STRMM